MLKKIPRYVKNTEIAHIYIFKWAKTAYFLPFFLFFLLMITT